MTDGTGTTIYSYQSIGTLGALQLAQETSPSTGATIIYAYDGLGRLSSRTVAGSSAETFDYDPVGRLTNHDGDLGAFVLSYLGQTSQIVSRSLMGSNLATTWSYLPNSGDRRLSGVSTTGLSAGQATGFTFATNDENQITGSTQTSDAPISYPPASLSQSASYNPLNQLTTLSGQTLTYDTDGNLTSDGTLTYTWDAENRLVAVGYPGQPGKATTFAYDGLGRRVQVNSTPAGGGSGVVTSYVWCGHALCQARNASGAVTKGYYLEGEYAPTGAVYYAPDQVGTVRRAFSTAAAPSYDNDPYGAPLQATTPATDFTYARLLNNSNSGLLLANDRAYGPANGRWLSRDPAGETGDRLGNMYVYVDGNPLSLTDVRGLAPDDKLCPEGRNAKEDCIRHCSDTELPTGDYGVSFQRCLAECMKARGFLPSGAPLPDADSKVNWTMVGATAAGVGAVLCAIAEPCGGAVAVILGVGGVGLAASN
ncbi:MAG TPA: RHS repeat-associated core domain-containing protein [Caulobacteraceae bacterium]|jgi:RHS repeat-associated protein|nr:RHS repeat-associated core domain-containing protein [Caulobacteraceae bacterium]